MRINYIAALSGAAVVASIAVAPAAQAASPFTLTGGTTSLTLDNSELSGLGLSFSGTSGTVSPAPGFNYGFDILSPSSNPGVVGTNFTFDYTGGAFTPLGGTIEHTGSLLYDVAPSLALLSPFEIGDFSIGFDNGSFFVDGFFVADNVSTGSRLFNLAVDPANASLSGEDLAITNMNVLFSSEFNDILENASGNFDLNLAGTTIGSAQINATAQAVPTPAVLPGLVTFAVASLANRRRSA